MAYYGKGPLDGTGQSIGLVSFWGFNTSDVDLTYTSVGLKAPTVPINTVLLGGLTTPTPKNPCSTRISPKRALPPTSPSRLRRAL